MKINKLNITLHSDYESYGESEGSHVVRISANLPGSNRKIVDSVDHTSIDTVLDAVLIELVSKSNVIHLHKESRDEWETLCEWDDGLVVLFDKDPSAPNTNVDPIIQFGPYDGERWSEITRKIKTQLLKRTNWSCNRKYNDTKPQWTVEFCVEGSLHNLLD